jgi:F-type H+-transporting ATPase subunit b
MDPTSAASFYAFVSLVIFLVVIAYLKVPAKIAAGLDGRAALVTRELDEAKRLREEAQALLADFQRRSAEAEREASAIVAEAKAEADRLTADTTRSLEEMIARRTKAAEAKIAQAETQAIAAVRARAADVAIAAAQQILATKVKGSASDDLIEAGIAQIRAKFN